LSIAPLHHPRHDDDAAAALDEDAIRAAHNVRANNNVVDHCQSRCQDNNIDDYEACWHNNVIINNNSVGCHYNNSCYNIDLLSDGIPIPTLPHFFLSHRHLQQTVTKETVPIWVYIVVALLSFYCVVFAAAFIVNRFFGKKDSNNAQANGKLLVLLISATNDRFENKQ
jgi:hypothetical protein